MVATPKSIRTPQLPFRFSPRPCLKNSIVTNPDLIAPTFLGLPQHEPQDCDYAILSLPFEATVSYGGGTGNGPHAVIAASNQVELWDDETNVDLDQFRFHTAPPLTPQPNESPADYLARVQSLAAGIPSSALVIGIGGEHSLTPPLVRAAASCEGLTDVTIVQIDAHTDLRDEYEGTPHSHACAMRRLTDAGASLIAIGIRASCREEIEYAKNRDISIYRAQDLSNDDQLMPSLLQRLGNLRGKVYLTVDIDGLAPSLCPGTGTPEPGGLEWWPALRVLKAVLTGSATLIGCDVVETTPMANTQVNEFTQLD